MGRRRRARPTQLELPRVSRGAALLFRALEHCTRKQVEAARMHDATEAEDYSAAATLVGDAWLVVKSKPQ